MIIYNVTTQPAWEIHVDWLNWMKEEHIPDVMGTGMFTQCIILRLLEVDESDGPTYAMQYHAESRETYDRYISDYAAELRKKTFAKWGNRFIAFRSLMQVVE